ncbi:hypothetical protein RDABS01_002315 [Bienertia sinuspersici]
MMLCFYFLTYNICVPQLVNHGMSIEFLGKIRDISKQFFELPLEEKEKYSKTSINPDGYGTDYPKNTSPISYRLFLKIYPEEERSLDRWPKDPQNFGELLNEYGMEVQKLHDFIARAMAQSLNLEEDSFLNGYGVNSEMVLRINYYPPFADVDRARVMTRHSDASALTFLLKDREVEALEVLNDGSWFKVPIIPHAIMVIIGDQIEIMSNGIFKSVEHRIRPNLEKGRISLAMFCSPDLEKEVGPLKELVTEDCPPLYKTMKRYKDSFEQYYIKGLRPISAVKI